MAFDVEIEKRKAKIGDGLAAFIVGRSYMNGENGVETDCAEAFRWYSLGAKTNSGLCLCGLGTCYENGIGIPKDTKSALNYFRKAFPALDKQASIGEKYSQFYLGVYYYFGDRGVPQDYQKAAELFTKSAEQGDSYAQCNLGDCYYEGQGVAQDKLKAKMWWERAAVQGDESAQNNLDMLKEEGY